jgi:D-alanine-D-alanine ligase
MHSSSPTSSTPLRAAEADTLLRALRPGDRAPLERILHASAVFSTAEIAVALELIDADPALGYQFVVAELGGAVVGYACFGSTPMTVGTYDLYWIAVDPAQQGRGIGRLLMRAAADAIRAQGGRLIVIETAGKPAYDKTRAFYRAYGCVEAARVPDFYAPGDDKLIFLQAL